jgi:hypothetical protein
MKVYVFFILLSMFIILSWYIIEMAKRYKFIRHGLVYKDKSVLDFLYGHVIGLIMWILILSAIIFQLIEIVENK